MSKKIGTQLGYGTAEEAGMLLERLQTAKDVTQKWVDQDILNSAVILVARHSTVVLHEAFGKINYKPDSPPAELDTMFMQASLAKPVTAATLMCLVEDGLVGLNHPITDYVPEFVGEGKNKVLIKHLLTHTSGITGEDVAKHIESKRGKVEIPPCEPTQHPKIHEFLFLGYDAPLSYPSGKEMRYSGCGYGYGLIVETIRRVTGKSFVDFAKERIFDRLGMKDSCYGNPPDNAINRVAHGSAKLGFTEWDGNLLPMGSSGLISTTMDMAVFMQMFLNNGIYGDKRILCPSTAYEMTHNQIPGIGARYGDEFFPEANWSYGWSMSRYWFDEGSMHSPKSFGHGGWGTTYLWGDPDYDLVGAFFAASNNAERSYREHGLFVNVVMSAIDD